MKTIYLILIVLGLIFGSLFVIMGNAANFMFCLPSYVDQLINYSSNGTLVFESCGRWVMWFESWLTIFLGIILVPSQGFEEFVWHHIKTKSKRIWTVENLYRIILNMFENTLMINTKKAILWLLSWRQMLTWLWYM